MLPRTVFDFNEIVDYSSFLFLALSSDEKLIDSGGVFLLYLLLSFDNLYIVF